jgi:phosphoribosylanthranilate isomerase
MTAVKICGITREEDVAAACELGAAILGFNFAAGSPRRISPARARDLAARMPRNVEKAGVFVGESRGAIALAAAEAGLDIVQIHRPVTPEDVEFSAALLPAVRLEAGREGLPDARVLARCRAILWDSSEGRGFVSDWSFLEGGEPLPVPVFLAGGLDCGNVGALIRRLRPAGVDVASGVESAPGIKDREKLERFFEAVREADRG